MAHYAFLDADNVVVGVYPGRDEGDEGRDWEAFYAASARLDTSRVRRTSYNTRAGVHVLGGVPYRKHYACVGFAYDSSRDAFIPPKPHASWVLDEDTCQWVPPVPRPSDGMYVWDESSGSWVSAPAPQ